MVNNTRINFFIILFSASFTFGQFQSTADNLTVPKPVLKLVSGLGKSIEWYDASIFTAYLLRNVINPSTIGDRIYASPMEVEQKFANQFSGSSSSLGSIDKDIIPNAIFYSRLVLNFGLDLFTDADVTDKSYQRVFTFKKSLLYTYVLTEYVKNLVKRTRPDGSDDRSFFSGHTSTTFAAATFLYKEFHDAYDEWDYLENKPFLHGLAETLTFGTLYGWASYVGYSRIHDKKHYISDVIVGALVGSAISYFVYEGYFGKNDCFLSNFSFRSFGKDLALNFRLDIQ